ncbi:MAG TPA: YdcF family protein [Terracidiphilus sp.]|nr:YdcF family protein [Terracidiphilus sp.]
MNWRTRALVAGGVALVGWMAWAALARQFAPTSNTDRTRFDTIVVLGTPADADGNPTPGQLARVSEGVREYERGVAPRMIFTGGPASNRFVEAQVMAHTAEAEGIPASAIIVEPRAQDTMQNACYATRIMKAHGWTSAEVVSSGYHLPRAAMIFGELAVEWRVHPAPPLEPQSTSKRVLATMVETLKTMRYLVYARWAERCGE